MHNINNKKAPGMSESTNLNSKRYKMKFSRIQNNITVQEINKSLPQLMGADVHELEINIDKKGELIVKFQVVLKNEDAEKLNEVYLQEEYFDAGFLGLVAVSIEQVEAFLFEEEEKVIFKNLSKRKTLNRSQIMESDHSKLYITIVAFLFFLFLTIIVLFFRNVPKSQSPLKRDQVLDQGQDATQYRVQDRASEPVPTPGKAPAPVPTPAQNLKQNQFQMQRIIEKPPVEEKMIKEERIPERNSEMLTFTNPARQSSPANVLHAQQIKDYLVKNSEITFTMGKKNYQANIKIRPAVHDASDTWAKQYQYLRPTVSYIITYPEDQWVEEKPEMIEFVELATEEEREDFVEEMHLTKRKKSALDFMFFRNLYLNQNEKKYEEAEYHYQNQKFNIQFKEVEQPLCVVSTSRNLIQRDKYDEYLNSLSSQNYTNFRIILVDDASNDNTTLKLYAYISDNYPRLKARITFVKNEERIGTFANKDSAIKENCAERSVVIDLDGDDSLIGRQVFNVINEIYQRNEDNWVVYTNYILQKPNGKLVRGNNTRLEQPIDTYRHSDMIFTTGHLKTYYAFVYMKVPFSYLTEEVEQDGVSVRKYPTFASGQTMMFSILELAGDKRVVHLTGLFYLNRANSDFSDRCVRAHKSYDEHKMRDLPPLAELGDQTESAAYLEGTFKPINIMMYRKEYERECSIAS